SMSGLNRRRRDEEPCLQEDGVRIVNLARALYELPHSFEIVCFRNQDVDCIAIFLRHFFC
ncbi:hypothetical protein, partial [Mesorhizobium sp. M8A.F.Ca.ET.207.01.1.1]|uniref:hypothetical protein n=1 Tax=Mesorhizobium sp. M8A.F.Ca.ET.207.01.1.1 TaxID=2563968 RepID=UPI001AEE2E39